MPNPGLRAIEVSIPVLALRLLVGTKPGSRSRAGARRVTSRRASTLASRYVARVTSRVERRDPEVIGFDFASRLGGKIGVEICDDIRAISLRYVLEMPCERSGR